MPCLINSVILSDIVWGISALEEKVLKLITNKRENIYYKIDLYHHNISLKTFPISWLVDIMASISRLNKRIASNEKKIATHQEKIFRAKEYKSVGKISKAKYYELKTHHNKLIRELNNDTRMKVKARQMLMKKEREKSSDKKKKWFFF